MHGTLLINVVTGLLACFVTGFIIGWVTAAKVIADDTPAEAIADEEEDAQIYRMAQAVQEFADGSDICPTTRVPMVDCCFCQGEACLKCGAGAWSLSERDCEHDVLARHEMPEGDQ